MPAVPQLTAYWRFILCDLSGVAISSLSPVATQRQFRIPMNRPVSLGFSVPSDDPHVNILHTDGYPYLDVGRRTIKAFRRLSNESTWTIRFNGIVWNIQDVTDGNHCASAVTVYDPYQLLNKRVVRASDGTFSTTVVFESTDEDPQYGDQIAKTIVNRTIAYAGPCGISTTLGTFVTAAAQSQEYNQQYVAPALIDLCDTGALDVWFDPVDRPDGVMVAMNAGTARGSFKSDVLLSYAAPGHSAFALDRSVSMDTFANSIYLYTGDKAHLATESDATSIASFLCYEDVSVLSDITRPSMVDDLAVEELAFRKDPRDLLTLLPTPERSPVVWRDYFVGDTVTVNCSIGRDQTFPFTREAIADSVQRVQGITLDIDDDGVERVSGVDVTPQGT